MPRNGTGKYLLPPGVNPVKPGTVIETNWANTTLNDIALALSNSLVADGQKKWVGNQNAGGYTVTNLGTPVNPSDAVPLSYVSANVTTAGNISGWERPESNVLPPMAQSAPTTVFVPAGKGYIINPVSGRVAVEWEGGDFVLSHTATAWITTFAVDVEGEIVQFAGNIDPEWARSNIILGTVNHTSGQIDEINNTPSVFGEVPYTTYDLAMALRNTIVSGNQLSGVPGGLALGLTAGVLFIYGGSPNTLNAPNYIETPAENPLAYFPVTGASTSGPAAVALPVTKYDPDGAGTVTDIPGDDEASTVFRLFRMGSSFLMLYGQHVYDTLDEARAAVFSEQVVLPTKLSSATYMGAIAVKKSATDLSDPTQATVFSPGSSGSGGSGSGGSPLVIQTVSASTTINGGDPNLLVVSTAATAITITLKNKDSGATFNEGDTVSVLQWGAGQVTVAIEGNVGELKPAEFFLKKTRGQGCVITAACIFPDSDNWSLAGDLAPGPDINPGGGGGGTPPTWAGLPFSTNWHNTSGFNVGQYAKTSEGRVYLRGVVAAASSGGAGDNVICTLPVGFRPLASSVFLIPTAISASTFSQVWVNADGTVTMNSYSAGTEYALDQIAFFVN